MIQSFRSSTQAVYNCYISKWRSYASENSFDADIASPARVANFLASLFDAGAGYSTVNSARSALSAYLPMLSGQTIGSHPVVCRVIKGVFEERPSFPKYTDTWNVNVVLDYFDKLHQLHELSLKELTLKTCMLVALVTGQRGHALHSLMVDDIRVFDQKCVIVFSSKHKTTKPGFHTEPAEILEFTDNEKLCPVRHLKKYLTVTKPLRKGKQLFISYSKPHCAVGKQTFSRWIKAVLRSAGIDTKKYTAHSTRSASCSAAEKRGVPFKTILKAGSWASDRVFVKFYKKDVSVSNFGQIILDGYFENKS